MDGVMIMGVRTGHLLWWRSFSESFGLEKSHSSSAMYLAPLLWTFYTASLPVGTRHGAVPGSADSMPSTSRADLPSSNPTAAASSHRVDSKPTNSSHSTSPLPADPSSPRLTELTSSHPTGPAAPFPGESTSPGMADPTSSCPVDLASSCPVDLASSCPVDLASSCPVDLASSCQEDPTPSSAADSTSPPEASEGVLYQWHPALDATSPRVSRSLGVWLGSRQARSKHARSAPAKLDRNMLARLSSSSVLP